MRAYHESLNSNMDAASEYISGENDTDFITDDMAMPIGYQESEGDCFGLSRMPDIDEMINSEMPKQSRILMTSMWVPT